MIRNIVFDMGQVLIRWEPNLFMELLDVPGADREDMIREVFREVEWIRLDRGTITEEEAARAISARLPEHLGPYVERMVSHWWEYPLSPVPGMAELVEELKGAGYGIYLLSNASLRLPEYFGKVPGSQYFDGKIVSAHLKLLKPEREIYEALFRTWNLKPEECFFVDDSNVNVEGGRRCGMDGAVFLGDVERLRRQLNEAGVKCKI